MVGTTAKFCPNGSFKDKLWFSTGKKNYNAQFCILFSFLLNCVKSKSALYCISSDIFFNHMVFISMIFFLFNVNGREIYGSNYKAKFCQNAKLSNTVGFTWTRADKNQGTTWTYLQQRESSISSFNSWLDFPILKRYSKDLQKHTVWAYGVLDSRVYLVFCSIGPYQIDDSSRWFFFLQWSHIDLVAAGRCHTCAEQCSMTLLSHSHLNCLYFSFLTPV